MPDEERKKATKYFVLQALEYEGAVVLPGATMTFPELTDVQLAGLEKANAIQSLAPDAVREARQALQVSTPQAQPSGKK